MRYILLLTSLLAMIAVELAVYYFAIRYVQTTYPENDLLIVFTTVVLWVLAKATIRIVGLNLPSK